MATSQDSLPAHRLALARELLDDIELGRLQPESLLLKASRLARIMEETEVQTWLHLELKGYHGPLDELAMKYARLTGRLTDEKTCFGYWEPFAGLLGVISTAKLELQSLKVPDVHFAPSSANPTESVTGFAGSTVMQATAPAKNALQRMSNLSIQVGSMHSITSKIMAVMHEFVTKTYYELAFRGVAESIFESHKRQVDALLAASAGEALQKIPAISERLAAGDREAISQAMSTCRRVLSAFADKVQPSAAEKLPYGKEFLDAGPEKYLNRLRYFIRQHCTGESREERLNRILVDLNKRYSAGTHDDVGAEEARALFVILYVTLGELLSLDQPAS